MYHYTIKENGKKFTLATWTGDSQACPRLAECVFKKHGLTDGTVEGENVTSQKCYAGRRSRAPFLTDTLRESEKYFHNELIYSYVQMWGASKTLAQLSEDWQDKPDSIEDLREYFKYT